VSDQASRAAARLALGIALPVAVAAGLVVYWMLGGFGPAGPGTPASATARPQASSTVTMPAPSLSEQPATVCRALLAALPDALRDRHRRPVSAGPRQNAAYGDPPITLACGAGPRPSIDPTATVYPLSGVCWYAQPGPDSTGWSPVDRVVPITVTVPNGYSGQGQWVIEFSAPIATSVPAITQVPTGCHG
jgi:hypothetical protein